MVPLAGRCAEVVRGDLQAVGRPDDGIPIRLLRDTSQTMCGCELTDVLGVPDHGRTVTWVHFGRPPARPSPTRSLRSSGPARSTPASGPASPCASPSGIRSAACSAPDSRSTRDAAPTRTRAESGSSRRADGRGLTMRSLGLPRTSVQHQFTFTESRLIRALIPMMGLEAASDNVFLSGEHV